MKRKIRKGKNVVTKDVHEGEEDKGGINKRNNGRKEEMTKGEEIKKKKKGKERQ